MLASVVFFRDSYANIVLITFSSLIIIELLNVYSKVNVIKAMMVLSSLSTLVVYGITIVLLKSYFDVSYI
jgi:phospholipid-translocating ATPase